MNARAVMIRDEAPEDRLAIHQGHLVVVVLGHQNYYPRFGFVPAVPKRLRCDYPVPDEVFMVADLVPGALKGRSGLVRYRPIRGGMRMSWMR